MIQGYLCVGGPLDCRTHVCADNRFSIHAMRPVPPPTVHAMTEIAETIAADRSTYYKYRIGGDVYVWLHETVSPEWLALRLIEAYRERKK